MENYKKGKSVEEPLDRSAIPIPNLPDNFLWMQVKGGSKLQKLLDHAVGIFNNNECKAVVWTGSGDAVTKTISCAEAMKRTRKMFQITKIAYRRCDEFWEPKLEGLDQIVVVREIPIIHILLSTDPLDSSELGFQDPDVKNAWSNKTISENKSSKQKKRSKVSTEEIFAMGLQTNAGRGKKGNSIVKTKSQAGKT